MLMIGYELFWIHLFSPTQPKQPTFSVHSVEKSSVTNPAQQKQHKQLALATTDSNSIFTLRFQPIQRLQPSLMTDGITNAMAQQTLHKKSCRFGHIYWRNL